MPRKQPYKPLPHTWKSILDKKNIIIPMNQREYAWGTKEINIFLDDIFNLFEEDKYSQMMGSIINLNHENGNDIYDGQQRILTITLILYTIGLLSSKLKSKINTLLTLDTDIDVLTPTQQEIKDEMCVTIIPNIYCVNPYDMKALVNIMNNKINYWVTYISNIDRMTTFDEHTQYKCNMCDSCISRKSNFIRHLENSHDYSNPSNDSKLYDACIDVYNYFVLKKYNEQQLINLYNFILSDTDIMFYDCDDPIYVSRMFDWLNNRGKPVEPLDIIKNQIIVKIPSKNRMKVYDRWETLKRSENKIYKKKFGEKIFEVAIQLYNKYIMRTIDYNQLFRPIINSEDTYREINNFFEIVEKLHDIMDKISKDKFGRLINNKSSICINWEGYMWCLLPIFYETGNIDTRLINLFVKWYARNLQTGAANFNNLAYSNEFIKITNELLKDSRYDYYTEIYTCLQTNKNKSIINEKYLQTMEDMIFKSSTNATFLLLFLETCLNTDLHCVPLAYTLEHILCQKGKTNLNDETLMNNIGNLTLLEGKNSENGHKGNSSLGAKLYSDKKLNIKKVVP